MAKKKKLDLDASSPELLAESVGDSLGMKPISLTRGKYVDSTFRSGSLSIDLILGGGPGICRWLSIIGPSGVGKSTALYNFQAAIQRLEDDDEGPVPIHMFDHEGSTDKTLMDNIGVSMRKEDGYYYWPSDIGENTYRFIRRYCKSLPDLTPEQRVGLRRPRAAFFIDSLDSMTPSMLDEAIDQGEDSMRVQMAASQMHSKYIKAIRGLIQIKGCVLITTNQLRTKPGVMYGNPEYETGGNAIIYYPDIKMKMSKVSIKEKNEDGNWNYEVEKSVWKGGGDDKFIYSKISTLKNKQFSPFQDITIRINLGRGIDPIYDAYSYLDRTGQMVGSSGKYKVDMVGVKNGQFKGDWRAFSLKAVTPEFRRSCYSQMENNTAFKLFFEVNSKRTQTKLKRGKDHLAVYDLDVEEGKVKKDKSKESKKKNKKNKKSKSKG